MILFQLDSVDGRGIGTGKKNHEMKTPLLHMIVHDGHHICWASFNHIIRLYSHTSQHIAGIWYSLTNSIP